MKLAVGIEVDHCGGQGNVGRGHGLFEERIKVVTNANYRLATARALDRRHAAARIPVAAADLTHTWAYTGLHGHL
ncbi:hypothetical protein D3C78_1655740 [compost metagenome]